MTYQRLPKLEVPLGEKYNILIQDYANPYFGESSYGKYVSFNVLKDGSEFKLMMTPEKYEDYKEMFSQLQGKVSIEKSKVNNRNGSYQVITFGPQGAPDTSTATQPFTSPPQKMSTPAKPVPSSVHPQQPDWDAIAEGKVRHGVAVAFIEAGFGLDADSKERINEWVDFIISGK